MEGLGDILVLAATEEEGGGSFLVSPSLGLMIWTLLAFGITLYLLNKLAFPRIAAALDRRRVAIEESIEAAENLRDETKADASKQREELLAATRRDIEHETRRALDELRKEVADLTVMATEKITRKSLTEEDHRRLIEDALGEVDFSELAGTEGNGR